MTDSCGERPVRRFTADDDGTEVMVEPDGELEVVLSENATTGHQWAVAEVAGALELLGHGADAGTGRPGAGGTHRFRFRAAAPGGHLVLHLSRSWETAKPPVGTFRLAVVTPTTA